MIKTISFVYFLSVTFQAFASPGKPSTTQMHAGFLKGSLDVSSQEEVSVYPLYFRYQSKFDTEYGMLGYDVSFHFENVRYSVSQVNKSGWLNLASVGLMYVVPLIGSIDIFTGVSLIPYANLSVSSKSEGTVNNKLVRHISLLTLEEASGFTFNIDLVGQTYGWVMDSQNQLVYGLSLLARTIYFHKIHDQALFTGTNTVLDEKRSVDYKMSLFGITAIIGVSF